MQDIHGLRMQKGRHFRTAAVLFLLMLNDQHVQASKIRLSHSGRLSNVRHPILHKISSFAVLSFHHNAVVIDCQCVIHFLTCDLVEKTNFALEVTLSELSLGVEMTVFHSHPCWTKEKKLFTFIEWCSSEASVGSGAAQRQQVTCAMWA